MIVGAIRWMSPTWKTSRFPNHGQLNDCRGHLLDAPALENVPFFQSCSAWAAFKTGGWRMALNEYEGRIVSLTDAETFRRVRMEKDL